MKIPRYVVLDKAIGQTPLQCMEAWRKQSGIAASVPLTYAGRLDPMASGKLLILIGEECKKKDTYLALDKTYEFSVLLGIGSDTHDVLGRLQTKLSLNAARFLEAALQAAKPSLTTSKNRAAHETQVVTHSDVELPVIERGKSWPSGPERPEQVPAALTEQLELICTNLTGDIKLPYPHFSSKTIAGKPLHRWTLENRLDEIQIPTKSSTIYSLQLNKIETKLRAEICTEARHKIDTIPEVTDAAKALGNDFRRVDIRHDWEHVKNGTDLPTTYHIAHFTCTASSGTYMRTLAKIIGERLQPAVPSLAWHIHRSSIGDMQKKGQV